MGDNASRADAIFEQKRQRAARFNLEQQRETQRLKDAEDDYRDYLEMTARWRREDERQALMSNY
jgi:hypothetical protein